ncbi:hypothetical protein [Thalassotalea hakodatensis]|uniref:hypothetical protein n=1 Tax=Thalassotalea hakodatensis TaxID=3030492 RepID=UPI00257223B8|nr:hypothetical protein [Thalassotalea hakodatensis]
MNIEVNGMKYLQHGEFYLSSIGAYLTLVFVKDLSTGMTKEYAGFLDAYATDEDVEQIMRTGFKPYGLRDWLKVNLPTND